MMNSNLVQIEDERFPETYLNWLENIYFALDTIHPMSMGLAGNLGIGVSAASMYDQNKEEIIQRDLKSIVSKNREQQYSLVLYGYDSLFLSAKQMSDVLESISNRKRKKDYELRVITASDFTGMIDKYLLNNFYVPDLIFVAVLFKLSTVGVIHVG